MSLDLVDPDGADLPEFSAGSHIDVECGPGLIRQYSLFNAPSRRDHYRIAILREPEGRGGSRALHANLQRGQMVRVSTPRNHFPLDRSAEHSILFAGGIGITPLLSMAEQLSADGASFEMHYSNRSRDHAALLQRLAQPDLADHVQLHFDDGSADQALDLPALLQNAPDGSHIYVCGPPGYMDFVISSAGAFLPDSAIHREYFTAPAQEVPLGGERAFEVRLARTGKSIVVSPDRSIAAALADHGIDVPLSCEQGICGTCIVGVLSGEPDHRDTFMSNTEHAANREMTVCCSRSFTDVLELDL